MNRRELLMKGVGGVVVSGITAGCMGGDDSERSVAEVYASGDRETDETERVGRVLSSLHSELGEELDQIESDMNAFTGVVGESSSEFAVDMTTERVEDYKNRLSDIKGEGSEKQQKMHEFVVNVVSVLDEVESIVPVVSESIELVSDFESGMGELDGDVCVEVVGELSDRVEVLYDSVNAVRAFRGNIGRGEVDVGEGLSFGGVDRVVSRVVEVVTYFGLIEEGFTPLADVVGAVSVVDEIAPDASKSEVLRSEVERVKESASEAFIVYDEMDDLWDANLESDLAKIKCVAGSVKGMGGSLGEIVRANADSGEVPRRYVMSVVDEADSCNYGFLLAELEMISRRYL